MAERFALGIVGAGRLVERGYLPALDLVDRFRLAAVADPAPDRRRHAVALAERSTASDRVESHRCAAEMVGSTALDAVVVASPPDRHLADARVVTGAGIPVLVEKPPASNAADALDLTSLRPSPWIGLNRRFGPGADAVRRAAPDAGTLDAEVLVEYRRTAWSAHVVRDDAWLDLGPHLVDLVRWIASCEIIEVRGAELSHDRAHVELGTTRGRATLLARTDRVHRERVTIRDGAGRIVAQHRLGGIVGGVRDRIPRRERPTALVRSIAAQLDAFATAIATGGHPMLATADDGVAAMRVLDAARASTSSGRTIPATLPGRT